RNFSLDNHPTAAFSIKQNGKEVDPRTPGSRQMPIPVSLREDQTASYQSAVKMIHSEVYKFQYPLTVKVQMQKAPLQGGIHWVGEEAGYVNYTIEKMGDVLPVNLSITGKCDQVNRDDGSCVDYAYIQVYNNGSLEKPVAKKRFY